MSKKDIERSKQFIFRDGKMIPRREWDKARLKEREAVEAARLKVLGLYEARQPLVSSEDK